MTPELTAVLALLGTIATVLGAYLGIRRSAKAQEQGVKSNEALEIIKGYKELQTEYKEGIEFLKQDFGDRLEREAQARLAVEKKLDEEIEKRITLQESHRRLGHKFDMVLTTFKRYMKWARGDRLAPEPEIPEWILERFNNGVSQIDTT